MPKSKLLVFKFPCEKIFHNLGSKFIFPSPLQGRGQGEGSSYTESVIPHVVPLQGEAFPKQMNTINIFRDVNGPQLIQRNSFLSRPTTHT